jgi:hypothetical protein
MGLMAVNQRATYLRASGFSSDLCLESLTWSSHGMGPARADLLEYERRTCHALTAARKVAYEPETTVTSQRRHEILREPTPRPYILVAESFIGYGVFVFLQELSHLRHNGRFVHFVEGRYVTSLEYLEGVASRLATAFRELGVVDAQNAALYVPESDLLRGGLFPNDVLSRVSCFRGSALDP